MKKEELKLKKVTLSSVKTGLKAGLTLLPPSVFCCTQTHHCALFLPPGAPFINPSPIFGRF